MNNLKRGRGVCLGIRSVFVLLLAGGVVWSCSGERVTTSPVTDAEEQIGQPLSKPAVNRDLTQALVVARVHQDQVPVSDVTVAFSRSVSGRAANYEWSATTDENGEARVEIEGGRCGWLLSGARLAGWEPSGFVVEYSD